MNANWFHLLCLSPDKSRKRPGAYQGVKFCV